MTKRRSYSAEFKRSAVDQIISLGKPIQDVAEALGVRTHILYRWRDKYGAIIETQKLKDEIKFLKQELQRVTDERDVLKKTIKVLALSSTPENE